MMYRMQGALSLLLLYVGSAMSFSWDIAAARDDRLDFYHNGTLKYSEIIPSAYIPLITFDPIHNRILFIDQHIKNTSINSFDLTNKKVIPMINIPPKYIQNFVYDPVTDLLFWNNGRRINWYSLKPGAINKLHGNLLFEFDDVRIRDIAVDSCRGFIYWIAKKTTIIRAKFVGTEREVVVGPSNNWLYSLTIDQQARKMYWIANDYKGVYSFSIECADLNGKNSRTVYATTTENFYTMLTVSKDFIYWGGWPGIKSFMQLPKHNKTQDGVLTFTYSTKSYLSLAANYRIEEQSEGTQVCDALKILLSNNSLKDPTNVSGLCVHGTEVSGESRCQCAHGYTGESCDVSLCHNYCLQGDCFVSAEGQPECRCDSGYSGQRCEVSICKDYCVHGDCFSGLEGQLKCRCNSGYSGDRCEVNTCYGYCLNNGVCSLYDEYKPYCRCTADYEGDRCEFPAVLIKCIKTVSMMRDMLSADVTSVTLSKGEKSTCASTVV